MDIQIKYKGTWYPITISSSLVIQERIDEALDSGSFEFFTEEIDHNIPPFSECRITNTTLVNGYWLCSSTCKKVVERENMYHHSVTLYEPTKLLECFIVGTKSFSVVDGASKYNTNGDRIDMLIELMQQKYGAANVPVYRPITPTVLLNERSYSFGSGSTLYDCLLEIYKDDHLLPKIKTMASNGQWQISFRNFNYIGRQTTKKAFTNIFSLEETQSVDDYCSQIESEMSNVVDRDTITTVYVSPRSTSELISVDTACLKLPSKVESVKTLKASVYTIQGPTIFIPYWLCTDQYPDVGSGGNDFRTIYKTRTQFNYRLTTEAQTVFEEWAESLGTFTYNNVTYEYKNSAIILTHEFFNTQNAIADRGIYATFIPITQYATPSYTLLGVKKRLVSFGVLNQEQYNLLSNDTQPHYVYYTNGSEYIQGLNKFTNSDHWDSILYGENGPWLKEQYAVSCKGSNGQYDIKDNVSDNYKRPLIYLDWEDRSSVYYESDEGYEIRTCSSYELIGTFGSLADWSPDDNDMFDTMFRVEYVPYASINASANKKIGPANETTFKASSKSYQGSSNTTDFNLLVPAMKRSVDMLGLATRTIVSLDNFEVGTLTDYGYIITKEIGIQPLDTDVVYSITYTLCDNYEQIAASIGIETQYEATNVASNGIVDRIISVEDDKSESDLNYDFYIIDLLLTASEGEEIKVQKIANMLVADDTYYFTIEADDNVSIGKKQKTTSNKNIYQNMDVAYSDENQMAYKVKMILLGQTLSTTTNVVSLLNSMPEGWNLGGNEISTKEVVIYKDSRERLIFQFKITIS